MSHNVSLDLGADAAIDQFQQNDDVANQIQQNDDVANIYVGRKKQVVNYGTFEHITILALLKKHKANDLPVGSDEFRNFYNEYCSLICGENNNSYVN